MTQSIPYAPTDLEPNPEARTFGMLCHLAALSAYFTGVGIILGPLIVWLVKKDQHPFVNDQGKEALNFNLSFFIYQAICFALCFVFIGFILWPIVHLVWLVLLIVASIQANSGKRYRYPMILRLVN
jgi:uncharacterized Tic20 family protein